MPYRWWRTMGLMAAGLVCAGRIALAAEFIVDSTADTLDAVLGDGLCADSEGNCTLRSAVSESNALAGADTIVLPPGFFALTLFTPFGDLIIEDDVCIEGAGSAETVLDGGSVNRVFVVSIGATAEIAGLRIQSGMGANGGIHGGAIANTGDLTLRNVAIVGNVAVGSGGGVYSILGSLVIIDSTISLNAADHCGGGVYNGSAVTIVSSTISNNQTGDGANCGGGGLYTQFDATVINSTISSNGATLDGGGIQNVGGGLSLMNVTVTQNTADGGNDGIGDGGGVSSTVPFSMRNSILSDNTDTSGEGPDCSGTIMSAGHNLIESEFGCAVIGDLTGVILGESAMLAPLADHGGATVVHALNPDSPAIDAGSDDGFPALDQRGFGRPMDGDEDGLAVADIGAFEVTDPDCNGNDTPDTTDIAEGDSLDCNGNAFPDECDLAFGMSRDCNDNSVPDECDLSDGTSADDNGNGLLDECEIPGDFDLDGDLDLFDYAQFVSCVTGPEGDLAVGCELADFDADGDVDLPDAGQLQILFTGGE